MLEQSRVGREQAIHETRIQTSEFRKQLCFGVAQRTVTRNFKGHGRTPLTPSEKLGANRRAGTRSRNISRKTETTTVAMSNRCSFAAGHQKAAKDAYPLKFGVRPVRFVFGGRKAGQKKKPSGLNRRAF